MRTENERNFWDNLNKNYIFIFIINKISRSSNDIKLLFYKIERFISREHFQILIGTRTWLLFLLQLGFAVNSLSVVWFREFN